MSSTASDKSPERGIAGTPPWLATLLGIDAPTDDETVSLAGRAFVQRDGMLRSCELASSTQQQTADAFAMKWHRRDTFESAASLARARAWLVARYGDMGEAVRLREPGEPPLLLDAGCGAAMSAIELFGDLLQRVRYLGVDISGAVDVARTRVGERVNDAAFMQADIANLPLPEQSVLHHADSPADAFAALARLLKPGGRFMLYVYRRKGPIREFSDDYVRERLQGMTPEEAWQALMPLSRLGQALGDLDVDVVVPEAIDLLGIPAGRTSVQRLFYWHVFKAFHDPALTLDELNHINYDWYAPKNAHRQTPEQVRAWCADSNLEVEREVVESAGITIIACKRA